jgi:hypothetical protein
LVFEAHYQSIHPQQEKDPTMSKAKVITVFHIGDGKNSGDTLKIDLDYRIQNAGTDYYIFANKVVNGVPSDPDLQETPVLRSILDTLFTYRSGVKCVRVQPFGLDIRHSEAVSSSSIFDLVKQGIHAAGFRVKEKK